MGLPSKVVSELYEKAQEDSGLNKLRVERLSRVTLSDLEGFGTNKVGIASL